MWVFEGLKEPCLSSGIPGEVQSVQKERPVEFRVELVDRIGSLAFGVETAAYGFETVVFGVETVAFGLVVEHEAEFLS